MRAFCRTLVLAMLLSAAAGPFPQAATVDPAAELLEALAGIERLEGRFTQQQFDETGQLIMESSGRFRLLRPGYFAWDIVSPDSQLVIADPQYVWHYDRDLATVTRRPVDDGPSMAPLQVLGGDAQALRDNFHIESGVGEGSYTLSPLSPHSGFNSLDMRLQGKRLSSMRVHDELGHRIVIHFFEVNDAPPLTAADFAFEPPAGVDVFYYDE